VIVLNPGNLNVLEARLLLPYLGVWIADLSLDAATIASAPSSGPVTIGIGPDASTDPTTTLVGTIDPRGSGSFSSLLRMRVLGGGGGWEQSVSRQFFAADSGLTTAGVYTPTAALVGEKVQVLAPRSIQSFTRMMGPARRVLDAEPSWWVDPVTGTTFVGPRPAAVADPSLTLIEWNAQEQIATMTCDALVLPGTTLSDPRLNGASPVVCDVEQVFGPKGSTVKAWCNAANPLAALANDLRSMVLEFSGIKYARSYLYRVTQQGADGRLGLQAVHPSVGIPDALPVPTMWGAPGMAAKFTPGTTVAVRFLEGDPTQAVVDLYDGTLPIELDLNATTLVKLAGGAAPIALAPPLLTFLQALGVWAGAVSGALSSAGFPIAGPESTFQTALSAAQQATPAKRVVGI
jgi:hypothetical protein